MLEHRPAVLLRTTPRRVLENWNQRSLWRLYCYPLDFMNGPAEEMRGGEVYTLEGPDKNRQCPDDYVMVVFKNDRLDFEERRRDPRFRARCFGPISVDRDYIYYEPTAAALTERVRVMIGVEPNG